VNFALMLLIANSIVAALLMVLLAMCWRQLRAAREVLAMATANYQAARIGIAAGDVISWAIKLAGAINRDTNGIAALGDEYVIGLVASVANYSDEVREQMMADAR
jgi:hypothetical protein